jgi:hypothetical protein
VRLLNRVEQRRIANAAITSPEEHTTMDRTGAVRSIQAADVTMPERELDALWSPMYLERLARTYWKYLSRVTLGLIRVVYTPTERAVVLIGRPFVLLRFGAPEYELRPNRGIVRWPIRDGLLVARPDYGHLEIDVLRVPVGEPDQGKVHVEVEVANFSPSIARAIGRWVYTATQARIHVLVTHGFLRSLAKLELEESAVGRFADPAAADGGAPQEPVNVGDTPWLALGGLVAALIATVALVLWRYPRR